VTTMTAFLMAMSLVGICGRPMPPGTSSTWGSLMQQPGDASDRHCMALDALDATPSAWKASRERLSALRAESPSASYVENVRVGIDDPRTKSHYDARGAVAIDPHRTARMILIGPGGTTALDLWVTKDHFRFAVPAIKLEKRDGISPDEERGLPVGFFRWWFLSPLAGRLLAAHSEPETTSFILKDGRAIVTVRADRNQLVARRREGQNVESIEWWSGGLVPRKGTRGRYADERTGLVVDVTIEDVAQVPPDPAAFADPGVAP